MSMWEINELLKNSIAVINNANLDINLKKNLIWNLENLPEKYQFDAGGFAKTENDSDFCYEAMNPYKFGLLVCIEAEKQSKTHFIYDWSTFLLNYWNEYFSESTKLDDLKKNYLSLLKVRFHNYNFENYKPIHASLTLYKNGNEWFTEEQNQLIKWFCFE